MGNYFATHMRSGQVEVIIWNFSVWYLKSFFHLKKEKNIFIMEKEEVSGMCNMLLRNVFPRWRLISFSTEYVDVAAGRESLVCYYLVQPEPQC